MSTITRRIFISSPADRLLDERRRGVKRAIMDEVAGLGYEVQAFGTLDGGRGLAKRQAWNPDVVDGVIRRCVGAAVLGFPRWALSGDRGAVKLATEYCHYEAALARAYHLPVLFFLEQGVEEEGVFGQKSAIHYPVPTDADASWARSDSLQGILRDWGVDLRKRFDVFLGYSSRSADPAKRIRAVLEQDLETKVLDWNDFQPVGSILHRIADAASLCSAGVFLFGRDDLIGEQAVPRDNVVFETGYFMGAKGENHVLVIREQGSKVPADLGGKIFVEIGADGALDAVVPRIRQFVAAL